MNKGEAERAAVRQAQQRQQLADMQREAYLVQQAAKAAYEAAQQAAANKNK